MSEVKRCTAMTRFAIDGKIPEGKTAIESQRNYFKARAKQHGVDEDMFKQAAYASFADDWTPSADMSKAESRKFRELMKVAKADYKQAQELKAKADAAKKLEQEAEKARKEQEKKEAEARAIQLHEAFTEASSGSTKLAKPLDKMLKEAVAAALKEDFVIVDGEIELKEGADEDEAFAVAFANLKALYDKSSEMQSGFALWEAKVAIAAEKVHGDQWPNYFGKDDPAAVSRIKKGMKAVREAERLDVDITDVPLSTVRALFEAKYDRDDEKNNDSLKVEAFKKFKEASEEAGRTLGQNAARQIVKETAKSRTAGASVKPKHNWLYIMKDGTVTGSHDFLIDQFRAALVVVSTDSDLVEKVDEQGDPVLANIPVVTNSKAALPAKEEKPVKEEKPAKKAEKKEEPKEEEEEADDDNDFNFFESEAEEEPEEIAV